ncbi:deoxyguanosinetriphosphate triphosphohydrolase [Vibrio parahaemolyticus]|nr:deoxyguanosinetriphosphate triphosphohydrolase [Vibrio parahaemolyticus]EHK9072487.1 deoxyguanosinetriphosphate triphosphohydrolase [Vibrio parahaemolyticus]EIU6789979.1 deoxyguanosinetriphosphate triphosphohydrolase [Vibrio parahaemolyticus]EIY6179349.1 deoxyguanosinetriphosphate triphosphohydrolase [Vibrio parahaemolyticus]EJE8527979.1 deoxyguanosinetriphosphate triphosphohydrolase [Vibrio parahaemolyticus]
MSKEKWEKLLSTKRYGQNHVKDKEQYRSDFHKDYDRIVFSSAFRRLGRKTQVHPMANHDHIHTRLTHSMEVSSVGRSLGNHIGAFLQSEDELPDNITPDDIASIVQAACLAHDIGNPPFGHAGEYAIRHWFSENLDKLAYDNPHELKDLTIFEGNAQGYRVVSKIESNFNQGGLRLTYATLGTLVKYPWSSGHANADIKNKYNFFTSERNDAVDVFRELGLKVGQNICRHPLSYLMEAADDICYKILDIEDALELNILRFEEVSEIFRLLAGQESSDIQNAKDSNLTNRNRIIPLRSKAIENLIEQCVIAFKTNYFSIMDGSFEGDLISHIGDVEKVGLTKAKDVTNNNIFLHQRKIELEIGAYTTLGNMLDAFITAINEIKLGKPTFKSKRILDLVGPTPSIDQMSHHECYMRVMDLVSGMTDNHATYIANQLAGRGQ